MTGEKARKRMTWAGAAIAVLFAVVGLYTVYAFLSYPDKHVPTDPAGAAQVQSGEYERQQQHPVELPK